MPATIKSVKPGSPASRAGVAPGDSLVSISGRRITDVLDYLYRSYDAHITVVTRRADGKFRASVVRKGDGEELGLEFESSLMDLPRSCANKCVFCFVDQLPRGMRETLYYKDDDTRLSFLQGNYVTLTNMSEREIARVIDMRISPINVSVHTMNPSLRAKMLGSLRGADGVAVIRRLAEAGITMNCQIVLCPGLNDGAELEYSMSELAALYPEVNSVSVVPVGLTRHREGLPRLTPFDAQKAAEAVRQVEAFARKCLKTRGSRIFFCADELYIKAERELPPDEYYEGYPQLENGVGMLRLLIEEFNTALRSAGDDVHIVPTPFTLVTGRAAEKFIESLLCTAREICDNITGEVVGVTNAFFGESVDVAGLVTGGDILKTLPNRAHAPRLLLPRNMLRVGETRDGGVFLDDVTVRDIESTLNATVRVVEQDGADLLNAILGL
ncbi:MAG: DUF512 domain-containing protein [Oscillospiraceae bacterium]|jgi:putative radical SAM enzyme (TIGR03279 family)|nr:DUF512 domain-containing protein [Oscillospiraceae bacterium]